MKLQWVGQCCFHIQAGDGRSLLIDPFQRVIGIGRDDFPADVVVFSHGHLDHCDRTAIPGGATVVTGPGFREVAGFRLLGVQAFHDPKGGLLSGEVTLYSITVDGFRIVHLSDLGEELPDTTLRSLGKPDVLLFPAGEHTTVSLAEAATLVARMSPRIAVPMAYHQPGLLMPSASLEKVEKAFPRHRRVSEINLIPGTRLPDATEVRILDRNPWHRSAGNGLAAGTVLAAGPAGRMQ